MARRHHCFNCGEDLGEWDMTLLAVVSNRILDTPPSPINALVGIAAGLLFGCMAVMIFGGRRA